MTVAALILTRLVAAPPEDVFDAFTDATIMAKWLAPGDDWRTEVHRAEAREGGAYALTMHEPGGGRHGARGTYRRLDRPRRIEFTWLWDHPGARETLVRVTLEAAGTHTRLILTHEQIPDETSRQQHAHGWEGCLGRLVRRYETPRT